MNVWALKDATCIVESSIPAQSTKTEEETLLELNAIGSQPDVDRHWWLVWIWLPWRSTRRQKNNYGRNEKATPDDVFNRVGHDVMDAIASNVPLNCYICDYKATTKDAYNEQLLWCVWISH